MLIDVSLKYEGSDCSRYLRVKFVGKEDRFLPGRSLWYIVRLDDPSHFENHPRGRPLYLSLSLSLFLSRPSRRAGNEKETSRTLILQRRDISRPGVHDEICIKRDFADFVFRRPSLLFSRRFLSLPPFSSCFSSSPNLDDTSLSAPGYSNAPAFFTLHIAPPSSFVISLYIDCPMFKRC